MIARVTPFGFIRKIGLFMLAVLTIVGAEAFIVRPVWHPVVWMFNGLVLSTFLVGYGLGAYRSGHGAN